MYFINLSTELEEIASELLALADCVSEFKVEQATDCLLSKVNTAWPELIEIMSKQAHEITRFKNGQIYIKRWVLKQRTKGSIDPVVFLHKMCAPDTGYPHDHSWDHVSLILRGGHSDDHLTAKHFLPAGSLVSRPAALIHRLSPAKECAETISLVATSHKFRDWAFVVKDKKINGNNIIPTGK